MLKIRIYSFSYLKSGIPEDNTPNGGGYVFDCRCIKNPAKENRHINQTGKDKEVIEFLESPENNMKDFMDNVKKIIDLTVISYLERGFSDLMVSFGCTGGQHRSVYAAEKLSEHLKEKFGNQINIILRHLEYPHLSHN
ncbi:MAG: ATP-binding protein [Ignavibacteria bacterium]|nr:ATP-binding protein [Ignavibacteria bacterium]